jgi:hypothetical protein
VHGGFWTPPPKETPIMTRFRLVAALAALAVAAGTSAAFAAPNAIADGDYELRKSPKNSAAKVNFVEDGEPLTITECTKTWCYAKVPGPDGWIRIDRVEFLDEDEDYDDDYDDGGFVIGKPGGKPGQGGGNKPQACFFADENYGGQSFCVGAGKSVGNVGAAWNDQITSIKLYGGAAVEVCEDEQFSGSCVGVGKSTPNVGWQWNDTVTSLSVY